MATGLIAISYMHFLVRDPPSDKPPADRPEAVPLTGLVASRLRRAESDCKGRRAHRVTREVRGPRTAWRPSGAPDLSNVWVESESELPLPAVRNGLEPVRKVLPPESVVEYYKWSRAELLGPPTSNGETAL